MPRQFELVVFDWDGTLIDSAAAIVACMQASCADLGLPVPDYAVASHVIGLGLHDALRMVAPDLAVADYPHMAERYRFHFLARDAALPLFPGTREMLDELRDAGHTLAIATGKSRAGLARALETAALGGMFAATRCADQCTPKPAPDMLLELMDQLDVPRERTVMIGDTTHDLQMAANAGVAGIGVHHGAHPEDQLAALRPLALLPGTEDLAAWLRQNA
jgi:phosphoglycolate phosphatase